MGRRVGKSVAGALAVAWLLGGCAGSSRPVPVWPYDSPVLPLLTEPEAEVAERRPLVQYVVLEPDDDGSVGEIDVTDGTTTVTLKKAYEAVDFDRLEEPYTMDPSRLLSDFATEVAHLPRPPAGFVVYFEYASTELTAESERAMSAILGEIDRHAAPEVLLAGHCDRAGSESANLVMSRRRAEAVRDLIVAAGLSVDAIELEWFGESQPAVATEDGISEGQNRRVEIQVR